MHFLETAARWAWDTSLAASILIIPALVAATFFRKPIFTPIRHMLGLLVVARLLLPLSLPSPLSVFNILQPESIWSTASQRGFHFQRQPFTPTETISDTTRSPIPSANTALPCQTTPSSTFRFFSLLPVLWTLGILVIFSKIIFQHLKICRLTRDANRITSGPAIDALNLALELSGCGRTIKLYSVPNLSTPALFGLFRPSILLPAGLAQTDDFTRLRLVCLHEIAHIKRFDFLINWLAIVAHTVHWFNPLVWLVLRRLRADQELLCDARVMRILHLNEHQAYGETLLALASARSHTLSTLIPVSSSFKQLKERIAMIKQFKPVTHRLLVFGLPLLAAGLVLVTFTAAANKKPSAPTTSEKVNAANDVDKADKKIDALEVEFANATLRVQDLEKRVDELRKVLRIVDPGDGAYSVTLETETIRHMEQDRSRAFQEYSQFDALYNSLNSKPRSELRQMIPTAYRDEAMDRLLEKLSQTEQQLVVMQKDYTGDHPEVVRLTTLIKTLNDQIENRLTGILAGLKAVVGSRKAIVESISKQIEEVRVMDAENAEKYRPYFKAKRDLETHQKFRDALYLRLLEAKAERAIGK